MKSNSLALAMLAIGLAPFCQPLAAQDRQMLLQEEAKLLNRSHVAVASEPVITATSPATFPSLSPRAKSDIPVGHDASSGRPDPGKLAGPTITVASSLVVVLGLFAGLVWVTRKFGSRSMGSGVIPKEVLQSLGTSPLDSRTRVTLLRCGGRILILAQTANGVQPISEITDPNEVRALTAACLGDSKKEFASTLQSIEGEKTPPGYLGSQTDAPGARARGRLFATA